MNFIGSLIGDYIHAHISNYYKYGISSPQEEPSPAGGGESYNFMETKEKIINNFLQKNKRKAANVDAGAIADYSQQILSAAKPGSTDKAKKQILSFIESQLTQNVVGGIQQISSITSSGNIVTTLQSGDKTFAIERKKLEHAISNTQKESVQFGTMEKLYKELKAHLEKELKKPGASTQEVKQLADSLKASYNNLEKKCKNIRNNSGYKLIKIEDEDLKTMMNIAAMVGNLPTSANLGTIGEYLGMAASLLAMGQTVQEVLDTLQSVATNSSATSGGFQISHSGTGSIDRIFDYNKFAKGTSIEGIVGEGKISLKSGTGKIDFSISFPNGSEATVSAKNANLAGGRSVTVGTYNSLLHTLQEIDDLEFINHWLNVTSQHASSKTRLGQYDGASEARANLYMSAHNAMKAVLTVMSLAGFDNQIDYLFVNNNTRTSTTGSTPIAVISINQLIDKLGLATGGIEQIKAAVSVHVNGRSIANDSKNLWENSWEGEEPNPEDARKRINNLLSELHKSKLKTALRPYALLQAMGNKGLDQSSYFGRIKNYKKS